MGWNSFHEHTIFIKERVLAKRTNGAIRCDKIQQMKYHQEYKHENNDRGNTFLTRGVIVHVVIMIMMKNCMYGGFTTRTVHITKHDT